MIKTCSWGTCDSNSEYDENGSDPRPSMFGVKFYGFPKPFLRSPKCKAWVKACGRKDFSVKQVTINSFICSKHFRGGKPSKLHPMPEPATAETTASGDLSEKGSTSDLEKKKNSIELQKKRKRPLRPKDANNAPKSKRKKDNTSELSLLSNYSASLRMKAFIEDIAKVKKIEFGLAPRRVAYAFQQAYEESGSMTICLRNALARAPHLTQKYKFMQADDDQMCLMTGFVSNADDLYELRTQILLLDKYVTDNHFTARASAIEELLFSKTEVPQIKKRNGLSTLRTNTLFSEDPQDYVEEETEIYCVNCRKGFNDLDSLQLHLHRMHDIQFSHNKAQNKDQNGHPIDYAFLLLQSFQSKHTDTPKCFICGLLLKNYQIMNRHCWSHAADFNFSCSWCRYVFENSDAMQSHILKKSCMSLSLILQKYGTSLAAADNKVIKIRANKDFTGVFPKLFKPYVLAKREEKDRRPIFKCVFCPFISKSVVGIIIHAREHVKDYPYRCMKCNFASASKDRAREHEIMTKHYQYVYIQRSDPLTSEEVKILEEMQRNANNKIPNFGAVSTETFNSGNIDMIRERNVGKSNGGSPMWLFCKFCDSAFLVEKNYRDHLKTCKSKSRTDFVEPGEIVLPDKPIMPIVTTSDVLEDEELGLRLELHPKEVSSTSAPLVMDRSSLAIGADLELSESAAVDDSETFLTSEAKTDSLDSGVGSLETSNNRINSCPEKICKIEQNDETSSFFPF